MSALLANIIRPDGVCSGRVEIKGGRGAKTSRTQKSVFKDRVEGDSPECQGGAGQRAQRLTLDPRGRTPRLEGPQVGPDTLARDMLDIIIFILFYSHLLSLSENRSEHTIYSLYLYILDIVTAGLRKSSSTSFQF